MAKTCPSCGYRPIGPFTDNCPICAEPVRNVRSDSPGFPGIGGMAPVWKWVIGGSVLLVLSVVGCCGIGMWQMGNAFKDATEMAERMRVEQEADRKARTVVVSAADLLQEFQKDPTAADRKYAGKYLELTGVIDRVGRGQYDMPFVVLHAGDDNAGLKIECFFEYMAQPDQARIKRLTKGQTITVRGEYDGQVSNLQVRECVLVK